MLLSFAEVNAQSSKFRVQVNFSPKFTVNNNTGIIHSSNAQDGQNAMAFGFDYSVLGGYRINPKTQIMLGAGRYSVNQKFKLLYSQFGNNYKNIYQQLEFFAIPISFEKSIFRSKRFNVLGTVNLCFVNDAFTKIDYKSKGNLRQKNGSIDTFYKWEYYLGYYNLKTINILYGFSIKLEYQLNKNFYATTSIQSMQGFKPLVTADLGIQDANGGMYNSTVSTTNGQSLIWNFGLIYDIPLF